MCEHQGDPDNGPGGDSCVCSSGATTTSVAAMTSGSPCPWTAFPITSAASVQTTLAPTQSTGKFLTTVDRKVTECTESVVSTSAGYPVTSCAGSSSVVSWLPHITVMAASSRQSVGTLAAPTASSALYTSVSSALEKLCPSPTPGQPTSCKSDPVVLTGIDYQAFKSHLWENDGKLTITVPWSNYTQPYLRESMIKTAITTFWGSASNASACKPATPVYQKRGLSHDDSARSQSRELLKRDTVELCTAPGIVNVEYVDLDMNGPDPAALMMAELAFTQGDLEKIEEDLGNAELEELCEAIVMLASTALEVVAPEFLPGEIAGEGALEASCAEAAKISAAAQNF